MKTNKQVQVAPVRVIPTPITAPTTAPTAKGGKAQQSTEIAMSCGGYLGFGSE